VVLDWVELPAHEDCTPFTAPARQPRLPSPPCDQPLSSFCTRDRCRDAARVSLCNGSLPGPLFSAKQRSGVAVCLPVLSGRLNAAWLLSWAEELDALRASQLTFYSDGLNDPWAALHAKPPRVPFDWLDVSDWLQRFESWARAQLWAIHDCLYRNAERGLRWALFIDADELPVLPRALPTLPQLARWLEQRRHSGATFGSVRHLSSVCGGEGGVAARAAFRAERPECSRAGPTDSCLDWRGRRKPMVRLGSHVLLGIHGVVHSVDGTIVHLNASLAWLKHVRGAAFAEQLCEGDAQCAAQRMDAEGMPLEVSCSHQGEREGGPRFARDFAAPDADEGVLSERLVVMTHSRRWIRRCAEA